MAAAGAWPAADGASGAAYDVVLLAHVSSAVVALAAVIVAGSAAWAASREAPVAEWVERYYRPGVNWAGRSLVLVPLLGFALVGMSHGRWAVSDAWIVAGLVLWVAAASLAEALLWPAERRIQRLVAARARVAAGVADGSALADGGPEERPPAASGEPPDEALVALSLRAATAAGASGLLLVAAGVLMVAKP